MDGQRSVVVVVVVVVVAVVVVVVVVVVSGHAVSNAVALASAALVAAGVV